MGFPDENLEKTVNSLPTSIQEQLLIPVDAKAEVTISADKMQAFLVLIEEENGGAKITYEMIMDAIRDSKVLLSVTTEFLHSLVEHPTYNKELLIAEGIPSKNGENGSIELSFNNNRSNTPKIREDGTVNFFDLDLVCNVKKGDHLVHIVKATEGIDGKNVFGETLKAKPGKNPQSPFGKNVVFTEDKCDIYAAIDGNVTYVNNQIAVEPLFRIDGDVNATVGNITFNGDIIVTGNVYDGFKIKAMKNITVIGMVEGGSLEAGGNIVVNGGIIGTLEDVIQCKGTLRCAFIEGATIRCENDVSCNYITNADVICEGMMTLSGSKASLIGGQYIVLKGIDARDIGSPNGAKTLIQLGAFGTLQEEKNRLDSEFANIEQNEKKIIQVIEYLTNAKKTQDIGEEKEALLRDAIQTKTKFLIEKSTIHKKLQELNSRINYEGRQDLIVRGTMYRGSKLTIKSHIFMPEYDLTFVRIYLDSEKNDIITSTI